jgi:hypothetical protein
MKWIKKLFRCPQDRSLILVWREEISRNAGGQIESNTKISVGRYTVLRWSSISTPYDCFH